MDDSLYLHNYHEMSDLDRAYYHAFIRPAWDERRRFFFEGDINLIGQMYAAEREVLFDTVVRRRPGKCFEVGTWSGGGSTYFIAAAFQELGRGELITLEAHPHMHRLASHYYANCLPGLSKHVKFIQGSDAALFEEFIDPSLGVECFFLDGSDTPEQTLQQFLLFEYFSKAGTIMMAHDWNDIKQSLVRPAVESDTCWKRLVLLGPPESVGMAVYEFQPDA